MLSTSSKASKACGFKAVPRNYLKKNNFTSSSTGPKKGPEEPIYLRFWSYWTSPKPIPERYTLPWVFEMFYICVVFGCTGSSTMLLVRPSVSNFLHLEGSMKEGPWAYRIASIVVMFPIYPILLLTFGTVAGRHVYFRHFAVKMLSRFGIPKGRLDPAYRGVTAKRAKELDKEFRKW